MRTAVAIVLLILAFSAGVARAEQRPSPGLQDPRIRSVYYNPDEVVAIHGYFGYQMMIEFDPEERIENVSIGDGLAWQITPNHRADLLFLKPIEGETPTNMTVVTDQRRYAFELTARRPGRGRPGDIAYVVRFIYPPPPPLPRPPPPQLPPPPPERKNVAYSYTGSRVPLPSLVFDDGRATYFQWPATAAIPALFLVGADGAESIVNFSIRNGYLVVEQLAPRFALRSGKEVTLVINDAWRDPLVGATAPTPHAPAVKRRHGLFGWVVGSRQPSSAHAGSPPR